MDDSDWVIRWVGPEHADAVLTLRLFIPGVHEGRGDQYHLARTRSGLPRPGAVPAVSSDDRVVTTGGDQLVCEMACADGQTPDGRGCGFNQTVSIEGRSGVEVAARLRITWTVGGRDAGSLEEELVTPWLGKSRKELGGGAWMAAEITPVPDAA